MRPFFKDDGFSFLTEIALGSVYRQAADVGEVLTTIDRIHDGQARSWVAEWTATADRLAREAAASAAADRKCSAAGQYLRASLYYSLATYSADGTGDPSLFASLWQQHRAAWDQFVDLGVFGGAVAERVEIPYEGTTLPGYSRALAFEHRIAAGVADPGVVDVSTTVLGHLPHMMIRLLEEGEREKFNRDMEWALKISASTRSMLALRMRPTVSPHRMSSSLPLATTCSPTN